MSEDNGAAVYFGFGIIIFMIFLGGGLVYSSITEKTKQEARDAANVEFWKNWQSDMEKNGCKPDSFISTRGAVRSVWKCPDGSSRLGPYE